MREACVMIVGVAYKIRSLYISQRAPQKEKKTTYFGLSCGHCSWYFSIDALMAGDAAATAAAAAEVGVGVAAAPAAAAVAAAVVVFEVRRS